jgi:hypothetical protein
LPLARVYFPMRGSRKPICCDGCVSMAIKAARSRVM